AAEPPLHHAMRGPEHVRRDAELVRQVVRRAEREEGDGNVEPLERAHYAVDAPVAARDDDRVRAGVRAAPGRPRHVVAGLRKQDLRVEAAAQDLADERLPARLARAAAGA